MKFHDVLTAVISRSGIPKMTLSSLMGKSYTFINTTLGRKSVPKTDTFALIADVCGFDLLVRQRSTGDEMLIDPPAPKDNTK
jgi:hypothetical protein